MSIEKNNTEFQPTDVLLIVPPVGGIFQPSLACHLLQACARERGFEKVSVLYANVMFASLIGEELYPKLAEFSRINWLVERSFGIPAFGMPSLTDKDKKGLRPELHNLEEQIAKWLDWVEEMVRSAKPKIVGCTSSYEQIASSIAILNRCKTIDPDIVTVMGGANCEGEMAEGIFSLKGKVDYVASGESEQSFPRFLEQVLVDHSKPERVLVGEPCRNMDALPTPVYHEFFEQYQRFLPDSEFFAKKILAVPYETSRGCWWGQKHHCTFCGLNGFGMAFREKSKERALEEFKHLAETYPITRINTVDNIMPHKYFGDLLIDMAEQLPKDLYIFYEQKANITLEKAIELRNAHIYSIQPGIESLDTDLLKIMDKGIKAYQNIALLRYSTSLGIRVFWNLLSHFPGDSISSYKSMLKLFPYLFHLQPPKGPCRIVIDRFSPYFTRPEHYNISNVRPKPYYEYAFPSHADLPKLAYHFDGDFETECDQNQELMAELREVITQWRKTWERPKPERPVLKVSTLFGGYMVEDTRGLPDTEHYHFMDDQQLAVVLGGAPLSRREATEVKWALAKKLIYEIDGRFIPLATAPASLLRQFDGQVQTQALSNVSNRNEDEVASEVSPETVV